MAMLTSGEYNLVKKNIVHEKKSMVFVKLTDSAQRALNNYFRNQDKCEIPIIDFNKDEGRISIPNCSKSATDSETYTAQFKFNVISNIGMQGRQGRFECVQHKRGTKQLIKFGQLTQRLIIHANEDVYETTKNRMAAIELEQRKNCTVQLDWNSTTRMNRKPKINRTSKSNVAVPQAAAVATVAAADLKPKLNELAKSVPEITNIVRTKSRPTYNAPAQKVNSAAALVRKPLRERIVHMLAVRPYKKPELIDALKRDGLRECDKPHLMDILMSASTLRENTYHLAKHSWNDVQEDWLFYTEQEKQLIKCNKLRYLTSPSSSDSGISVSSNQSPKNNGSAGDKSPSNKYKRPGYFNGVDGLQTKRQRISHFVRQDPPPPKPTFDEHVHEIVPSRATNYFDELCSSIAIEKPLPKTNASRNANDVGKSLSAGDRYSKSSKENLFGMIKAEINANDCDEYVVASDNSAAPKQISNNSKTECTSSKSSSSSSSSPPPQFQIPSDIVRHERTEQKPKYLKEYVTITNMEQRRNYKSDFEVIFKEYKRVHEEVHSISNSFAQLGESLRQHKKGSPKYNKIEAEIFRKYYALKQSPKFQAAKKRFDYLHDKLSHIKNLVHVYDERELK